MLSLEAAPLRVCERGFGAGLLLELSCTLLQLPWFGLLLCCLLCLPLLGILVQRVFERGLHLRTPVILRVNLLLLLLR